ncbi:15474_t:CDS:2 [Funneliformis geosporum]|nr:15474_t:CDS:2 [Funneliformis geosporum]
MVPGSESKFKFTRFLMTVQRASLISSWIDNKVFVHNDDFLELSKVPYEFRLLACVGDSDQLIGGYNPVCWSSQANGNALQNDGNFESRVVNSERAIRDCTIGYERVT